MISNSWSFGTSNALWKLPRVSPSWTGEKDHAALRSSKILTKYHQAYFP